MVGKVPGGAGAGAALRGGNSVWLHGEGRAGLVLCWTLHSGTDPSRSHPSLVLRHQLVRGQNTPLQLAHAEQTFTDLWTQESCRYRWIQGLSVLGWLALLLAPDLCSGFSLHMVVS